MKNSARIALAASVVWFAFTFFEVVNRYEGIMDAGDALGAMIIGLVVIWLLKFILGTFVDKKNEK